MLDKTGYLPAQKATMIYRLFGYEAHDGDEFLLINLSFRQVPTHSIIQYVPSHLMVFIHGNRGKCR